MLFPENPSSFGVLLKGSSLSEFPEYSDKFNHCFIVNDFKKEVEHIGSFLEGKKIVHFVNKSHYAPLYPSQYLHLNIDNIQIYQKFNLFEIGLLKAWLRYTILRKKIYWLPDNLLKFNKTFGKEFVKKFPNTGILAVIYALEIIRPKELWVFGMDFYKSNYLYRRDYHKTLSPQIDKYAKLGLIDFVADLFKQYPSTNINFVTSYKEFPEIKNVKKITVNPIVDENS
jgi:hypothetical protein